MNTTKLFLGCLAICALPMTAFAQTESTPKLPEHFAAVAYVPRAAARTTSQIDIRIKEYSSDQEVKELAGILLDSGSDALLKALQNRKEIGSISFSSRVGFYDFKVVRSRPTETGRRIVAVSDRPIGFREAWAAGRSTDYAFGIMVLNLKMDKKGKEVGEGTLVYAGKINIKSGNTVEIENYGLDPIRIVNVRKY